MAPSAPENLLGAHYRSLLGLGPLFLLHSFSRTVILSFATVFLPSDLFCSLFSHILLKNKNKIEISSSNFLKKFMN